MQDIANDAGINRTLLNYYFRTKDQLFEAVFRGAMGRFVPDLGRMLQSDIPFEDSLTHMIETVIQTMIDNPQIPGFVLQELSSNPERMPQVIKGMGLDPDLAVKRMTSEGNAGVKNGIDPRQIIISLLSMCIFPFAARPVVTEILFNGEEKAVIEAMKERKKLVPLMVRQIMLLQKPMS